MNPNGLRELAITKDCPMVTLDKNSSSRESGVEMKLAADEVHVIPLMPVTVNGTSIDASVVCKCTIIERNTHSSR